MATTAQYSIWLREAENAYQRLVTGQAPKVFVDQNGERIEYNNASLPRLFAYITYLKQMISETGTPGPLNVWM